MDPESSRNTLTTEEDKPEQPEQDDRIFFKLIEKAGLSGRYQNILVLVMCFISYLTGGMMLITPYLFYQDPYDCGQSLYGNNCFKYVCSLDPIDRKYYIPEATVRTIPNTFGDYRCQKQKYQIDFVMTMMYIGNVAGFITLTLVGDLMGRKLLMVSNLIIALVGLIITIFCVSLSMASVGLFLVTFGIQNTFNICFFFISETMDEHSREKFQVLIQLFYGAGVLINVLWYWAFYDWQLIFTVFYFIPLVAVIMVFILLIQDTPMCLVMRYPAVKALHSFKMIAKMNKQHFHVELEQLAKIKAEYELKLKGESNGGKKAFSIIDLFRYSSLRMMTIMLIVLQLTVAFQFYAPALMLDQFNLSLFINGIVIGFSELIAYPIVFVMISRVKRRTTAYGCFAVTLLCSIILIFIWDQGNKEDTVNIGSSIGVLALIFIFRFAISVEYTYFYVYFNQLYPTQIRVLGTGLVSTMGGVTITIAPVFIQLCLNSGFPIMIVFGALSLISGLLSSRLPETLGAPPHDQIKELRDKKVEISKEELQALVEEQKKLQSNEQIPADSSSDEDKPKDLKQNLLNRSEQP